VYEISVGKMRDKKTSQPSFSQTSLVSGYGGGGYVDQQLFKYKIWLIKEVINIVYTLYAKEIIKFFSTVFII